MTIKKLLLLSLILFFKTACASTLEICPSIEDIKNYNFNGWLPLYIENEELAMDADVADFVSGVTAFDVARYNVQYDEAAHCFYQGTNPMNTKIIFAKNAAHPVNEPSWVWWIENRQAQCNSKKVEECGYIG